MSPRWKYQLKQGMIWAAIMIVIMTAFDYFANDGAISLRSIIIRTVVFSLGGIFIVGYFSWKAKLQKEARQNS